MQVLTYTYRKKINLINLEILQCLRPKEVAVQGEDVQPWKTEQGQYNFSFHNLLDPITTLVGSQDKYT